MANSAKVTKGSIKKTKNKQAKIKQQQQQKTYLLKGDTE